MADVLIVCVREDEPQAKALAEMFEAAGFSIGGAPSNDAALRSSGAGVVVWSQASIRSRPFLDAAQRVINADKAVVASLIEPPPPDSIGNSLAFDLSHWDGDPNDPSLDPLFFAVDRLVNAARAGVGAGAPRPSAFDEPPPRPVQQLRAAPPPRAAAPPQPRPAPPKPTPAIEPDVLGTEAEHWRAIRDSQDPNAFMEYLARYGARGTFSEVAELRLQQLAAGSAPPRAPAPPRGARGAEAFAPQARRPEPVRRVEPAPAPMSSPRRPEGPAPRPPDAALPRRPRAPEPATAYGGYDRSDLREPPREGGGAMRAVVLIALLGIVAVGAGLYFGGGIGQPNNGGADVENASDVSPSDPLANSYDRPDDGVSFADATEPSTPSLLDRDPAPRPTAPPREPERSNERATSAPETTERATPPRPSTPNNSGGGGPVSLQPGGASTPAPSTTNSPDVRGADASPLPPFIAPTTEPVVEPAPRTTTPPGNVVFTQRPTPRRISDLYPQGALRRGVGGRVQLDCRVLQNLTLSCTIASESPADAGFGRAALAAAESYRVRPTLSNGASSIGSTTRIAVNFQAPQ
jgi:protein TonB